MTLLVSIVLEDFRTLWLSIARQGRPPEGRIGSRGVPPEHIVASQGGRLLTICWDTQTVTKEVSLPTPAGFAQVGDALWVASAWTNAVTVLTPEGRHTVTHPLLNDAHGLEPDGDGILVACAGSDAVVDLISGQAWHAEGETVDVTGQPLVLHSDYRSHRIPTLHRALHLSSVVRHQGRLLATSLHRGAILSLEARAVPVLSDLLAPHGLRHDGDGLLVCDSRRGQVLELDADLAITARHGDLRWVQDAARLPDGRIVALDVPDLGRPDRAPSRIVELTTGASLSLPDGWRPHTLRAAHA